ncbi:MAG TPA: hypothetical protein VK009_17785 [Chloroflexota bacterium]|nr:hypothetical protein [Chloroflexota bacterium]
MSVYGINKVCYLAQMDLNFRERLKRDPEAALVGFPLTHDERRAFLEWDMASLYKAGAHTFLLSRLPRFESMGMTRADYIRSMRSTLTEEERRELEAKGQR